MTDLENLMQELLDRLHTTVEYNQYQNLLANVRKQPELYQRICEYHRRSLELQLAGGDNFIQRNNDLQNEYMDLQNNGLSNEFLAAEHQYCMTVRKLQQIFYEGVNIETSL